MSGRNRDFNYMWECNQKAPFAEIVRRRIEEKNSYQDTELYSLELYQDIKSFFSKKALPNQNYEFHFVTQEECQEYGLGHFCEDGIIKAGRYFLVMLVTHRISRKEQIFLMGSDYIGASIWWAYQAGLSYVQIGDFLKVSRQFGGHLLWPVQIREKGKENITGTGGTINQRKGGEKGFCDRIDLTLCDLKQWYSDAKHEKGKLKNIYNKYQPWLDLFQDFNGFVEFFCLNDNFCQKDGENYQIKNLRYGEQRNEYLTTILDIPDTPEGYLNYVKNVNKCIEERNKTMWEIIGG